MKKFSVAVSALLVGTILMPFLGASLSTGNGAVWIKHSENPIDLGVDYVGEASVIWDGVIFRMWYQGATELDLTNRIYYATSSDGVNWAFHEVALDRGVPGSWDSHSVGCPVVLFDGIGYKMWYIGVGEAPSVYGMVGYATSSDGITWIKYEANPVLVPGGNGGWDDYNIGDLTVMYNGTHYRMWYGGQPGRDTPLKTGAAISGDGVSWTKYPLNPVLVPGSSEWENRHVSPGPVIMNGSHYLMWYNGQGWSWPGNRIGLAVSPDGFAWSKYEGNPVLDVGPSGSWDERTVSGDCVVAKDSGLLMWYTGANFDPRGHYWGIGLAISYALRVLAEVDFDPDTLNLKSNGEWITCYIELSAGLNVGDIDVGTILLNDTIEVDLGAPAQIGDYDWDGIADLMVKFDRSTVIDWLRLADYNQDTGKSFEVNLKITGMVAGTTFEGADTVKVLLKG
jgi:hypothetical protein